MMLPILTAMAASDHSFRSNNRNRVALCLLLTQASVCTTLAIVKFRLSLFSRGWLSFFVGRFFVPNLLGTGTGAALLAGIFYYDRKSRLLSAIESFGSADKAPPFFLRFKRELLFSVGGCMLADIILGLAIANFWPSFEKLAGGILVTIISLAASFYVYESVRFWILYKQLCLALEGEEPPMEVKKMKNITIFFALSAIAMIVICLCSGAIVFLGNTVYTPERWPYFWCVAEPTRALLPLLQILMCAPDTKRSVRVLSTYASSHATSKSKSSSELRNSSSQQEHPLSMPNMENPK